MNAGLHPARFAELMIFANGLQWITIDKYTAYPVAMRAMKWDGEARRFSALRQVKFLSNTIEQVHERVNQLVRPRPVLQIFRSALLVIAGYEVMAMIPKGQTANAPARDLKAHCAFVAALVSAAA